MARPLLNQVMFLIPRVQTLLHRVMEAFLGLDVQEKLFLVVKERALQASRPTAVLM
jgi:hypothetical protein